MSWPARQARNLTIPYVHDLEELTAKRDALLAARYRAVCTVEMASRRVTYATNAQMAAAITDLEHRIEAEFAAWSCSSRSPRA
jgi:hypothetical protein